MSEVPLYAYGAPMSLQCLQPTPVEQCYPSLSGVWWLRVVHLGRYTCHAISGRGDQSTRIPDGFLVPPWRLADTGHLLNNITPLSLVSPWRLASTGGRDH